MDKYLSTEQVKQLATINRYEYPALMAIIAKESSGHGFSSVTGKIIIQFEPKWFKKLDKDWPKHTIGHTWQDNKVSNQTLEWLAFSDAFNINPEAAMKATSIGMMQVMGFHFTTLGFSTVGEMWDFAKESEYNQIVLGIRFIKSNYVLDNSLRMKMWSTFARIYNGSDYKKYNYDTDLDKFYRIYSRDIN